MELGIIGLGRMGLNLSERLLRAGHKVVGYARHAKTVNRLVEKGGVGAYTLEELVSRLTPPRYVWLMIPSGIPVDDTIHAISPTLEKDDTIIDGGNSNYRDTVRRASTLNQKQIHYVDVGTSGGIWGLTEGYSLMVGGEMEIVERLRPIFETLAPAPNKGWGHVGPTGAGHFVKMVHNGIEYGLMEAYAEGFGILKRKKDFELDLYKIAKIWRDGSVIRSWLLDLTARALSEDSELKNIEPFVEDSGEGRWTIFEAIDLDLAAPVITLSLIQRLRSRDRENFSDKLLALMREQFGGHSVRRREKDVSESD